jgi:Lon protease-like protein
MRWLDSRVSNTIHLPLLKTLSPPTSFTALGWGGLSVFPTQTRILNISRSNHDYMSHLRALEKVMSRSGADPVFGLLWGQPGHVGTLIRWRAPERLENGDLRLHLQGIGRFVVTKLTKTGLRAMFDIQARQFDDTDEVTKSVALQVMSELFGTEEKKPTVEEQHSVTSTARSVSMLLASSVGCSLGDKQFMLEMTSTLERLRLVHQIVSKKKTDIGPEVLTDI